jgi:ABC-type maltose transport system permease subunit
VKLTVLGGTAGPAPPGCFGLLAFASYLMTLAPMVIVSLLAQRWIISGVTQGAVKA